jgi:hypothetical protein
MAYQIIRIDKDKSKTGGNTHGWQVRAGKNMKMGYHSRLFSDGKYGGSDKALAEAEKYLQKYLQEHPEYNIKTTRFKWQHGFNENGTLHSQNKSGRNGVYRSRTNLRNDKSKYRYFWGASYTIDRFGKTKVIRTEKFFIDEYGEKEAKRLAVEFREMWEAVALEGVEAVKEFLNAYREGRV